MIEIRQLNDLVYREQLSALEKYHDYYGIHNRLTLAL